MKIFGTGFEGPWNNDYTPRLPLSGVGLRNKLKELYSPVIKDIWRKDQFGNVFTDLDAGVFIEVSENASIDTDPGKDIGSSIAGQGSKNTPVLVINKDNFINGFGAVWYCKTDAFTNHNFVDFFSRFTVNGDEYKVDFDRGAIILYKNDVEIDRSLDPIELSFGEWFIAKLLVKGTTLSFVFGFNALLHTFAAPVVLESDILISTFTPQTNTRSYIDNFTINNTTEAYVGDRNVDVPEATRYYNTIDALTEDIRYFWEFDYNKDTDTNPNTVGQDLLDYRPGLGIKPIYPFSKLKYDNVGNHTNMVADPTFLKYDTARSVAVYLFNRNITTELKPMDVKFISASSPSAPETIIDEVFNFTAGDVSQFKLFNYDGNTLNDLTLAKLDDISIEFDVSNY